MNINYIKTSEEAKDPFRKFSVDAGFDLYATWKNETEKYVEYGTNLIFEIPEGYVGLIFPRSSVTNKDLMLKNSVGVIDASYRGEIMFRFAKYVNNSIEERAVINFNPTTNEIIEGDFITVTTLNGKFDVYEIGDRIGQIVFLELPKINLNLASELSETERGSGGYGHTGK